MTAALPQTVEREPGPFGPLASAQLHDSFVGAEPSRALGEGLFRGLLRRFVGQSATIAGGAQPGAAGKRASNSLKSVLSKRHIDSGEPRGTRLCENVF